MKLSLCLFAFLIIAAPLEAQSANVLQWDYAAALPAEVATYTQTVTIDGVIVAPPITCVVRTGIATDTTCAVTIPVLATGSHVISVLAAKGGMTAELRVTGLNPANAPKSASGARIVVTVTVTIP